MTESKTYAPGTVADLTVYGAVHRAMVIQTPTRGTYWKLDNGVSLSFDHQSISDVKLIDPEPDRPSTPNLDGLIQIFDFAKLVRDILAPPQKSEQKASPWDGIADQVVKTVRDYAAGTQARQEEAPAPRRAQFDEPMGVGAVVKTSKNEIYQRTLSGQWYCDGDEVNHHWRSIKYDVVAVLSNGVTV